MDAIEQAIRIFVPPGQTVSVQALKVGTARAKSVVVNTVEAAVAAARNFAAKKPLGVYLTPNPVRPDLAGSTSFPKDEDIVERRWLLIDSDPCHPPGTSASEEESKASWDLLDRCRAVLTGTGLRNPVVGFSGNGWHLCYPVLLPNDDAAKNLLRSVLRGLQDRCGDQVSDEEDRALKQGQFLPTPKAVVGTECHDAKRIWPVYGTGKRKGTPTAERPHRQTFLLEGVPWDRSAAEANVIALNALLHTWQSIDDLRKGRPETSLTTYVATTLKAELDAVGSASVGKRNKQLNESAFNLGTLIGGLELAGHASLLPRSVAESSLVTRAADCGLDASEAVPTVRSGLNAGIQKPRDLTAILARDRNGHAANGGPRSPRVNADNSTDPLDQDATAADLIIANVTIRWGWYKWLPAGVLSVLASEPGIGKTRFCADLARRVYKAMPWPDGAVATFPAGSRTLWVPADNQHAELGTLPQQFDFPPECLYLNATKRNPFAGTMLDDEEDLRDFEARIRRVKPAIVFVDTTLNATERTAHKPEDARAFFTPLQAIAQRTGVVMLLVTHLNAAGKPLGRRIQGQARLVMQLEKPDESQEHRRKLYVVKSNSLYPAPLGVTMTDAGNDYDTSPPEAPKSEPAHRGPDPEKLRACCDWLSEFLRNSDKERVSKARTEAEFHGYSTGTLYKAKEMLGVEEFTLEGRKWWRLAPKQSP